MTLLQMSGMGGMMVLAFALLRLLAGKRLPRRAFLWMWTAAVCRFLLPFRVSSPMSVFNLVGRNAQTARQGTVVGVAGPPAEGVPVNDVLPVIEATEGLALLPLVWVIGAALVGGYLIFGWLYWRRRFHRAVSVPVSDWREPHPLRRSLEIRELEGLRTPLTWGLLHPVILLPTGQTRGDSARLNCILTHEYVHIRRFDALRKLALALVLVVHWYHPAAWLLHHLASRDMELYCDQQALDLLGEGHRKTYAQTLLAAAERQGRETIPLCNFFGKSMIEERIVMMKEKKTASVFAVVMAVVLLVGVTTVFATAAEEKKSASADVPYQGTAEAVDEIVATGKPLAAESDVLIWPAEGCDTVSVPFGRENPVTGVKIDHMTIAGERGANILAAAAGTVIDSGWQDRWGNYLEIDHGDGLVTFYTHLEETCVSRDITVEQGEVIGTLGQSGMATGPCLGFYVSSNGVTVDPMEWFDR